MFMVAGTVLCHDGTQPETGCRPGLRPGACPEGSCHGTDGEIPCEVGAGRERAFCRHGSGTAWGDIRWQNTPGGHGQRPRSGRGHVGSPRTAKKNYVCRRRITDCTSSARFPKPVEFLVGVACTGIKDHRRLEKKRRALPAFDSRVRGRTGGGCRRIFWPDKAAKGV